MLDFKFIKGNREKVEESIRKRGMDLDLERLLKLGEERSKLIQEIDHLRHQKNILDQKIAQGEKGLLKEAKEIKEKEKSLSLELEKVEKEFNSLLEKVPNILLDDVPEGKDEKDNVVLRTWGEIPSFDFKVKDHVEIGELLDIIDIKRAVKISGSRFYFLKGDGALLELALINFVVERLTNPEWISRVVEKSLPGYYEKPFKFIIPPVLIKPQPFWEMARLSEEDKEERYYIPKDDLYLIGSAEHTLGAMHRKETLKEEDLPLRYLGFSACFRREAGSYGKDVRGILRVHQFDKLEMQSFILPEDSIKEQEFHVAIQEALWQELELPYRVMLLCSGDMGKPDARQIDLETWIPSQERYRETHSSDLMLDYQARRLNTKVKRKSGKKELVHTADATALAIGRTIIAILENYQQKDGSVKVPKVLQPYLKKEHLTP